MRGHETRMTAAMKKGGEGEKGGEGGKGERKG